MCFFKRPAEPRPKLLWEVTEGVNDLCEAIVPCKLHNQLGDQLGGLASMLQVGVDHPVVPAGLVYQAVDHTGLAEPAGCGQQNVPKAEFLPYQVDECFATIKVSASDGRPHSVCDHIRPEVKQICCATIPLYNETVVKVKENDAEVPTIVNEGLENRGSH